MYRPFLLFVFPYTVEPSSYAHRIYFGLGIISNLDIKHTKLCMWVTCKYYSILYKALDHPRIFRSCGGILEPIPHKYQRTALYGRLNNSTRVSSQGIVHWLLPKAAHCEWRHKFFRFIGKFHSYKQEEHRQTSRKR